MRKQISLHLLLTLVFGLVELTLGDFMPYKIRFTLVKSPTAGRLGPKTSCPDSTRQISLTQYLQTKADLIQLDIDYISVQYINITTNSRTRSVLITPGGGPCYQDLASPADVIPSSKIHGSCKGLKNTDNINTEVFMEKKTFKESCRLKISRECNQTLYDAHCVPCNSGCSDDCYVVSGTCKGEYICEEPFTDLFCNTTCEEDRYGPSCSETCSPNCKTQSQPGDRNCSQSDGTCLLGCIPGWQGNKCDKICSPGTYGDGCKGTCVGNCLEGDTCSHINGTCPRGCDKGWENIHPCDKSCADNTYGVGCSQTCSTGCVDGECDRRNGTCLKGCLEGYRGPQCSKCPKGTYGKNCAFNCGEFCGNGTCDAVTGTCSLGQCARGWSGPKCNVDTCLYKFEKRWWDFFTFLVGCGIGIGVAGILMIVVFIIYKFRCQTTSRPMNRTDRTNARQDEQMELSQSYKL
ncbi:multiple epidermal growth factor-like domains protein 10 [Saccostrea echinata]|uniref:multiple epidermal growth factor-like domains protein 10 n=1 Tax=Saccostrea echinata TaxID=191078 RepID=UPI002A816C96|nr:multiple epidermal growth factor-like domains protein 10 [Saccostrea echinata]